MAEEKVGEDPGKGKKKKKRGREGGNARLSSACDKAQGALPSSWFDDMTWRSRSESGSSFKKERRKSD
jgi:hypothetical protein